MHEYSFNGGSAGYYIPLIRKTGRCDYCIFITTEEMDMEGFVGRGFADRVNFFNDTGAVNDDHFRIEAKPEAETGLAGWIGKMEYHRFPEMEQTAEVEGLIDLIGCDRCFAVDQRHSGLTIIKSDEGRVGKGKGDRRIIVHRAEYLYASKEGRT